MANNEEILKDAGRLDGDAELRSARIGVEIERLEKAYGPKRERLGWAIKAGAALLSLSCAFALACTLADLAFDVAGLASCYAAAMLLGLVGLMLAVVSMSEDVRIDSELDRLERALLAARLDEALESARTCSPSSSSAVR